MQALSLGGITNGVYNLEQTAAYAAIANDGVYTEPIFYTEIYDHSGKLLYTTGAAIATATKANNIYLLSIPDVNSIKAIATI